MTEALLDTGPLVAFLKRDDHHHAWAVGVFAQSRPPFLTCEAVLTEACYLLRTVKGGPEAVLELVQRGVVRVDFAAGDEAPALRTLIAKYGARTMDLADACLLRMSERRRQARVVTVDRQFRDVYRRNGRQIIPTLLPPEARRRR